MTDSEDSSVSGRESKVTDICIPAHMNRLWKIQTLYFISICCWIQEVKEEEAGSEGDPEEGMELKEECVEGEGPYLSEVERAASESEDGYGPASQRYTADSLASSPASSSQL